jgi:hypothetical protein
MARVWGVKIPKMASWVSGICGNMIRYHQPIESIDDLTGFPMCFSMGFCPQLSPTPKPFGEHRKPSCLETWKPARRKTSVNSWDRHQPIGSPLGSRWDPKIQADDKGPNHLNQHLIFWFKYGWIMWNHHSEFQLN